MFPDLLVALASGAAERRLQLAIKLIHRRKAVGETRRAGLPDRIVQKGAGADMLVAVGKLVKDPRLARGAIRRLGQAPLQKFGEIIAGRRDRRRRVDQSAGPDKVVLAERKMQANQGALVVSDDMRLLDAEHFEKTARVFDNQIVCEPDLAGGGIGAALPQRVERHDPEVLGENPKVSFPGDQIPAKPRFRVDRKSKRLNS